MKPSLQQANMNKVFNFIAQHDAQATIVLAEQSTTIIKQSNTIAQATLSDSTAMRTIATMTLIFLPATFICVSIAPQNYATPAELLLSCSPFSACLFLIGMQRLTIT
jgi:hypothetical protein